MTSPPVRCFHRLHCKATDERTVCGRPVDEMVCRNWLLVTCPACLDKRRRLVAVAERMIADGTLKPMARALPGAEKAGTSPRGHLPLNSPNAWRGLQFTETFPCCDRIRQYWLRPGEPHMEPAIFIGPGHEWFMSNGNGGPRIAFCPFCGKALPTILACDNST